MAEELIVTAHALVMSELNLCLNLNPRSTIPSDSITVIFLASIHATAWKAKNSY